MKTVFKIGIEIIFGIWFGVNFVLIFFYFLVGYQKMGFPDAKVVSWDIFILIGVILLVIFILNLVIFYKIITKKKAQPFDWAFSLFYVLKLVALRQVFHFFFYHCIELVNFRKYNNTRTSIFCFILSSVILY